MTGSNKTTFTWILLYPDGTVAGVDQSSGGYPYPSTSISGWKFWYSREAALDYRKIIGSFAELTVARCDITITPQT